MSLRTLKIVVGVSSVLGILGFFIPSVPQAAAWFCFFVAVSLQVFIGLQTGEISSTLGLGRWGFTYRRDETPLIFMWAVIVQSLLALFFGFAFLFSL